jgi:hypothetical protein
MAYVGAECALEDPGEGLVNREKDEKKPVCIP